MTENKSKKYTKNVLITCNIKTLNIKLNFYIV